MNKKQFDDLFMEAKHQLLPLTEEQITEKLAKYQSSPGKIDTTHLAVFAYMESIKYANDLVYALLSEIAVDK